MSEDVLPPPPEPQPEPVAGESPKLRRPVFPWLYAAGFVILAVAIAYVWQHPANTTDNLDQQLAVLDARLTRLEHSPTGDIGLLQNQVATLAGRIDDQAKLGGRLDAISGRIEALSGRSETGIDGVKQQVDDLTARIAALEANATNLDTAAKRLNRIARLQEASFALDSGRPIGDIPGAPEELTRYAHTAPPTEAKLRRSFPSAADAAMAARQPDSGSAPLLNRVMDRAESLMTIRRGDKVLVGDATAIAINKARSALDSGDLASAVAALQSLTGQPAQAMAPWLAQAKALLSARAVLAEMVDHA